MSIQILWGVLLVASALCLTWMSLKLVTTALKCSLLALVVYALLTPATQLQTQVDGIIIDGRATLSELLDQAPSQEASIDFIAQIATESLLRDKLQGDKPLP